MSALYFVVETLFSLAFLVFLLRLVMQMVRADFRNPLAQAIVRLTNPLVMPLRRVLPPAGKIDSASVFAVLLIVLMKVAVLSIVSTGHLPGPFDTLRLAALEAVRSVLWFYFYAIFLYALLSMIAPGTPNPLQPVLAAVCEPLLRPIRRRVPPLGGLDLSALWLLIAIQAALILLRTA